MIVLRLHQALRVELWLSACQIFAETAWPWSPSAAFCKSFIQREPWQVQLNATRAMLCQPIPELPHSQLPQAVLGRK